MDISTARKMNELTSDFYNRQAESFSQTRQSAWLGWQQVLETASKHGAFRARESINVLDLACGNLRFEAFLCENLAIPFEAYAVDNCIILANLGKQQKVQFQQVDIMKTLLDKQSLTNVINAPLCDFAVAFGFMHHVPTFEMRVEVLKTLATKTRPSGIIAISFWQFLNSEKLREKAEETTKCGRAIHNLPPFEENDYLLGWQHAADIFRYCHHFTEEEIDALVQGLGNRVKEIARFTADGKEGNLNRYLLLQVV